ncbi:50S ribosomal protein L9, partial [Treponema sp. R6D11]
MKVVLTKKVLNLGQAGDIVEVTAGYARNMLIPKGLAKEATAENQNLALQAKEKEANTNQKILDNANALAEKLKKDKLVIDAKVGENGKLFGSITAKEIAEKLGVDKSQIKLAAPIKQLGEYT